MAKVWWIAAREYGAMVATKAFLVSILFMPLLMFGGIAVSSWVQSAGQGGEKTIVIVDGTGGEVFADLERAAQERNASAAAAADAGGRAEPKYILRRHDVDEIDDAARLALSDEVRADKTAAFAEIPPGIVGKPDSSNGPAESPPVKFYAQNAVLSAEKDWVRGALNAIVSERRIEALGFDPTKIRQATAPVPLTAMALVKQSADGANKDADQAQGASAILVPLGFVMLMLMVLMLSAQPMLESVMEEKAGRVAEVLLGSVNAFQLMVGKLVGNVAGSLSAVAIYAAGLAGLVAYKGWGDVVPMDLLPWFVVYQILAVLLFGSIFLAVGAAVGQLKEAQSLLLPVWMLMCIPMFVWIVLVREPNGPMAIGMSLFPFSAPLAMVLRMSTGALIPLWQITGSVALLLAAALLGAFVAGRIFRIGILWQGKTPKVTELVRWGLKG